MKLNQFKFMEKTGEGFTFVLQTEGEEFSDYMDLPEDFKKMGFNPRMHPGFPPIPQMMIPPISGLFGQVRKEKKPVTESSGSSDDDSES